MTRLELAESDLKDAYNPKLLQKYPNLGDETYRQYLCELIARLKGEI